MRKQQLLPTRCQCSRETPVAETTPTPWRSGELERGEIPQVAALGNALTALFNTLGISQNAYAVRISMDKSIVSRYLRGRRVPPQDFVDRLIREAESRRGASVQPEVRSRISQLRLDALKVCDPETHELETLRAEMARSQRKVLVLARQQEALHDLLDKKESEVGAVRAELEQIRQDWTEDLLRADRAEIALRERVERDSSERERLIEEIAQLKADLSAVVAQRADAERRCEDLASRIREMEEELGARYGTGSGSQLPLGALQRLLATHLEAGEQREASQELAEAAWERPIEDVVELTFWLWDRGEFTRRDRLATEVVHARPIGDVVEFGHAIRRRDARTARPRNSRAGASLEAILNEESSAVRSPQEIVTLLNSWAPYWDYRRKTKSSAANPLLALLRSDRNPDDVAEVIAALDSADERTNVLLRAAIASPQRLNILALVPRMVEIGREDMAASLCAQVGNSRSPMPGLLAALDDMSEEHCRVLFSALLRNLPLHSVADFLGRVCLRYGNPGAPGVRDGSPATVAFEQLEAEGHLTNMASLAAARIEHVEGPTRRVKRVPELHTALSTWAAGQE
ncbi:helix-turn-helix domain-containing protein [Streptomyces sp. NPDC001663]|uniref:helix-turn-helix domain-containing protein n=1 Tax=Streptomyces sp. NPDC001663 TaxID=3364597 RepID=UPI0036A4982B